MNFLDYIVYGYKYNSILLKKKQSNMNVVRSVTYVVHEHTRNWILGAKARRLSKYSELHANPFYSKTFDDLPQTDGYFFLHPNVYISALQKNSWLIEKKNIVMFTHPEFKNKFSARHRVYVLNKAHKVIFLNRAHADLLVRYGLKEEKVEIMHLASDANTFQYHERNNGKICVSMAYYERKNPQLLIDVVKAMPHRSFIMIGREWNLYKDFINFKALPNLVYYENPPYEKYVEIYRQCDVFLSTSKLEGGPVPLLETMLCNMVPVVSKTGFCVDIVKHGENGFLFDIEATADEVVPLIEKAYEFKGNTRNSVIEFTWEKYAKKIDALFIGN
jgi:glycosyltransferase involved in cell wall biosynthesis